MTQLNSSFPKWAPTLLVELIRATPEQIGQNNRLKNLLSESRTLCSTSSQDAECSWAEWIKQLKPTLAEDLMLRMIFHSPRKDQWEGWFTTTQEQLDESNIQLNEKLVIASKLCSNPDMESAWSIMTRYSREPAFEIAVLYAVHRARQMSHQTFKNRSWGKSEQTKIAKQLEKLAKKLVAKTSSNLNHAITSRPPSLLREVSVAIMSANSTLVSDKSLVDLVIIKKALRYPRMAHLDWIILPSGKEFDPDDKETVQFLLSDALCNAARLANRAAEAIAKDPKLALQANATKLEQKMFTIYLKEDFLKIFGSYLYGTLTKVVSAILGVKVSDEDVKKLRSRRKQRKRGKTARLKKE